MTIWKNTSCCRVATKATSKRWVIGLTQARLANAEKFIPEIYNAFEHFTKFNKRFGSQASGFAESLQELIVG